VCLENSGDRENILNTQFSRDADCAYLILLVPCKGMKRCVVIYVVYSVYKRSSVCTHTRKYKLSLSKFIE
jgi:hypothetical protein